MLSQQEGRFQSPGIAMIAVACVVISAGAGIGAWYVFGKKGRKEPQSVAPKVSKVDQKKLTAVAPKSSTGPSLTSIVKQKLPVTTAGQKIDQLVQANYKKHSIRPNEIASDHTFVRRIYLDIVGRIPTYQETREFLASDQPDKRSKLIDVLLNSEGYVLHNFHWWSDLLRAKTNLNKQTPGYLYLDWIKSSLRENKPYDKMVYELLVAEGRTFENGAAGYYMRDQGMPLDNMANTTRIFLGTQVTCAQCHDHPFDDWTQKQFYELAAYTFGVMTRDTSMVKTLKKTAAKEAPLLRNRVQQRVARPLSRSVSFNPNRKLRLPDDYEYDNAKPKEIVKPHTLFGDPGDVAAGGTPRDVFAKWLTSPENPRFTKVIANRLWKKAMGHGLFEPVDDLREDMDISNPELLGYLTALMKEKKYDTRAFLKAIYNTQTYQRESFNKDVVAGKPFHYPGPAIQRMSAEQIWDSILALSFENIDTKLGKPDGQKRRYEELIEVSKKSPKEMIAWVKETEAARGKGKGKKQKRMMNMMSSDMDEMTRNRFTLQQELKKARKEKDQKKVSELQAEFRKLQELKKTMGLVRAAFLPSPAPPGHFLRQFGQSDREAIQAASKDPTVTQILTLLNGPMFETLTRPTSILSRDLAEARTADEKVRVIFLSLLHQEPDPSELKVARPVVEQDPKDLIWALLNTKQFIFIL
jgi:hypothetical protein